MLKISLAAAAVAVTSVAALSPAFASTLYVGPARHLHTLAAGVAAAKTGDTIILDQGTYTNQWATVSVPLTIIGAGAGAVLQVNQPISNHKGIIVADADLHVSNVTFVGAQVSATDGNNGAGIRAEAGNLAVSHCKFNNNQDGILVNPNAATSVTIDASSFSGNGIGDGYTHAIYANGIAILTVTNSSFTGTNVGHDIKSRAHETVVRNTTLDDGVNSTASYAIDLPNGGVAYLDGLTINQGQNTGNPTMISYGEEGNLNLNNTLTVSNSTFNNTRSGSSIGVNNYTNVVAALTNDTFNGVAMPLQGAGTF